MTVRAYDTLDLRVSSNSFLNTLRSSWLM